MNITILLSSVRDNRLATSVLQKVRSLINNQFTFTLVDPLEYQLPLLNLRYYEMKEPGDTFKQLHDIFENTDGFIIVSAEYNHGIPPALKNMLDHFGFEFNHKCCGIVTYSDGPIGGARCCEQLRMVCSTLGMPPIGLSPAWGLANKVGTEVGKSFESNFESSFNKFLKEFIWYTEALIDKRNKN